MRGRAIAVRSFTWLLVVLWLLPLFGLFMTSVRPYEEVAMGWWHFKDATFTVAKYKEALTFPLAPLWKGILNSLLVTIPGTVLPITVAFFAGYALSRHKAWYSDALLYAFLPFTAMPAEAIIIPLYDTFSNIGLMGSRFAVILAISARAVPWVTLFFRNYFDSLPRIFEEAAAVDGATYWVILSRVIIPLSKPAVISLSVMQFIGAWNTFIYPLVFLQPFPEKWTAVQMVATLKAGVALDWSLVSAGSILVATIPLLVFLFLNRYYVKGLLGSGEWG